MADNNTWFISLTIVAVVAIVAVFGLVKMTGYVTAGDFFGKGGTASYEYSTARMMEPNVMAQTLAIKMKTETEIKQQYGYDVNIAWVTMTYEGKAAIGGIVLNADGSYNSEATERLVNLLGINSPNTEIYVIPTPGTLKIFQADSGTATTLGLSPGSGSTIS